MHWEFRTKSTINHTMLLPKPRPGFYELPRCVSFLAAKVDGSRQRHFLHPNTPKHGKRLGNIAVGIEIPADANADEPVELGRAGVQ